MRKTTIEARALSVDIAPAVLDAASRLIDSSQRRILGLVGAPGSGKSTLSAALRAALGERAQVVPMDGYHLSNRQLERLGRTQRKGAPDTFDAWGYRHLLGRIRASHGTEEVVYAPGFYRDIEEPIAASIAVDPVAPLVITEGNYLLLADAPWPAVRGCLDEVWYLDVDLEVREQRLVARHMQFGRSERDAREWVANTDAPNAERIEATAATADRLLWWSDHRIDFKSS